MKKTFLFTLVILSFMACKQHQNGDDIISLDREWKLKTGDNSDWAQPDFRDDSWETVSNRYTWEEQGYVGYNGYAWYRMEIILPSKLRKDSYFKDSLQFLIGKIDDTDQTFLNGEPLGSNGKTIIDPEGNFEEDFEENPESYNIYRRYVIPADDPRIKWDQKNLIAIRVHDHGGGGGLYSPDPSVSMVDLKEFISLDIQRSPFKLSQNHYSKEITIINKLQEKDIAGKLTIGVKNPVNDEIVYKAVEEVLINSSGSFNHIFDFDAAQDNSYLVEYSFLAEEAKNSINISQLAPYILTPPAPLKPRINSTEVYGARAGNPFQFLIPVSGERPMSFVAENLPYGLELDESTGIISGRVYSSGDYEVTLTVRNELGKDQKRIIFRIGDKIALTPPLGWNSWNVWGLSVDDEKVRDAARMIKESGLANYGWTYINIDDGWEAPERTPRGELLSNEKFPDMKALSDYVHNLGLKIGIYSSPGPLTCGGYLGSYEHEFQDARTWEDWGIDFLKYDWCSYRQIAKNNSLEELQKPYITMRNALDRVNRDIVYSLCQYGMGDVWRWGKDVGGNMWRTTGDITDTWESMSAIGFNEHRSSGYAEPGHWNDVDMMVVGWVGWGPDLHLTRLTPDEQYTHVSLWALLSSPMLLGCDLTKLEDFTLNLLTNHEVLAVHQDSAGNQADKVYDKEGIQVWVKELGDGSSAVGFFNLSDERIQLEMPFSDFDFNGSYQVRDLWRQSEIEIVESSIQLNLPSHGVLLTHFRNM